MAKRLLLITLGFIFLALGVIGAILPLMPAFPFLLASLIAFGKSSEKLELWFKGTSLYKNNLESFIEKKGMRKAEKIRVLTLITLLFSIGFIMMKNTVTGRVVLVLVWIMHLYVFIYRIKTRHN